MKNYLPAADAGLYTSENESFGLSILETLFFGKPVVAFRIGGIPEVVGDAARLHDFGDIAAMAHRSMRWSTHPISARNLVNEAARASRHVSPQPILFLVTKQFISVSYRVPRALDPLFGSRLR